MVKLLRWEIASHSQLHVFSVDAARVIRSIHDANYRLCNPVQVSLIGVETVFHHEENCGEDFLSHRDLVRVLKSHHAALLHEVVLTEFFKSVEGTRNVSFSRLEGVAERATLNQGEKLCALRLQVGHLVPDNGLTRYN